MAQNAEKNLDADELLHLALNASKQGKSEDAITFLKRALTLSPDDARLHYLLGAEHAQIGLYDRAVEGIAKAVALDPSLDAAHFQLGLLHLTSGRVDAATQAWKTLDKLPSEHPFRLFKTGLLHLVKDEFEECESYLKKGIEVNTINAPLNNDMMRILNDVRAQRANQPIPAAAQAATAPASKASTPKSVVLDTYRKNKPEGKEDN